MIHNWHQCNLEDTYMYILPGYLAIHKYHHFDKDEVKNIDRLDYKLSVVLLPKRFDNYCRYNQADIDSSM